MRFAAIILALVLASPAFAAGWSSYTNSRYGASADVPPGYTALGPEAAGGKGQTFADSRHTANLTIYGDNVPGKNFEAYVEQLIRNLKSYEGWTVQAKTITPDWAELSSGSGGNFLRIRAVASCDGSKVAIVKYQGRIDTSLVSHLFRSLKSGTVPACP